MKITLSDLKKKKEQKIRIDFQEENLHKDYPNVKVQKGFEINTIVGLDMGGSQSRITFLSKDQLDIDLQYAIPSKSYSPAIDLPLETLDTVLYNNMDSTIQDLGSREGFIDKKRVVRAYKAQRVNTLPENELTSSIEKIKSETLYLNIVDTIGYAMVQFYGTNLPSVVNVKLGVALPPKEINTPPQRKWFTEQLNGSYQWTYNKTGASFIINLDLQNIKTEPEAHAQCQFLLSGLDFPELQVHLSGGSRSIGVEILSKGVSIFNKTFDYGGTQLANDVADAVYLGAKGVPAVTTWRPSLDDVKVAIETGLLKNGNSVINISDTIKAVKRVYADKIFQNMTKEVMDVANYKYRQLEVVTYDGRLFWEGDYCCSISDMISEMIKKESPETTCISVEDDNKIPLGCICGTLYEKYAEMFGIEDTEDEDEYEEEVEAKEEIASDVEK